MKNPRHEGVGGARGPPDSVGVITPAMDAPQDDEGHPQRRDRIGGRPGQFPQEARFSLGYFVSCEDIDKIISMIPISTPGIPLQEDVCRRRREAIEHKMTKGMLRDDRAIVAGSAHDPLGEGYACSPPFFMAGTRDDAGSRGIRHA